MNNATLPPVRRNRAVPWLLGVLLVAICLTVLLVGVLPAYARRSALENETLKRVAESPRVTFVLPTPAPAAVRVVLPARLEALQQTHLYAQMGGYLGPMQADMGDSVKAGQLLVEIETPILDRQIEQNSAAVAVAKAKIDLSQARLDLARATLARLKSVGDSRAVSQQTIDEATANERTDGATLEAARAELGAVQADGRRLAAQKLLARIVAPFDGEITARGYDAGALAVADKTDAARPIFTLTNREEIRAFIDLPQTWAAAVLPGGTVEFTVKEMRGQTFEAKISRLSPDLDTVTRTRLVEARIPNAQHELLPGMFAEAALTLPRARTSMLVPGEAIVIREGKPTLALIDAQEVLHYLPVELGRDTGSQVELLTELPADARVAVNLARQLPEATKVRAVPRAVR